jgi:hypothetical protein
MVRRLISATILVACAGVYAFAATERATFILTDGERKSGAVAFHTESHENLIDGYLNLGDDAGGREFTIPVGQVAVIAFAGGQPSESELAQVPASGHFLVLRDGRTETGSFVNMIGGDTLVWMRESGEVQRYALTAVNRVYLNPQAARTIFNYVGPTEPSYGGPTEPELVVTRPGEILVRSSQEWNDGGVFVRKGERVSFEATGQIAFGSGDGQTAGPDGNVSLYGPTYPVPWMAVGGLIGRVGDGAAFPIGSNTEGIVMPDYGRLTLGVNDDHMTDNTGYFMVIVRKQ